MTSTYRTKRSKIKYLLALVADDDKKLPRGTTKHIARLLDCAPQYVSSIVMDEGYHTRRSVTVHGTMAHYTNQKCRCDPCRLAYNDYQREYQRKRRLRQGMQPRRPMLLPAKASERIAHEQFQRVG